MKTLTSTLISAALAVLASSAFAADEGKEKEKDKDKAVTLEGSATCAKCDLGTADKCATVLQVKDGDKTETYYVTGEPDKDFHKKVCKTAKDAKATGKVTEKDGKKMLEVTSIEVVTKK
ncbi:DUF6370 family protein [Haloferula sp. BvORR071]|uniref:DUF6370 family protein n=1 Tax=Haloferula sp. BvORR071 TaxID=1396141 RepID=UPI0006980E64|nr:DUF6370 family protein [Haloferula sp. BvORR071]